MTGFVVGMLVGTFFGWTVCAFVTVNALERGGEQDG